VAGGCAAEQLESIARAAEGFGEEFQDGFVGGGIDGRRDDFDLQFVADWTCNFVARGARLDFQGDANAIGSLLKIGRHRAAYRLLAMLPMMARDPWEE
jgi:hypothetical protein